MYMNEPVKIPEAPGKLVFRPMGESVYILYETGRTYNPERKNTRVERKVIGLQIPDRKEFMLPNENYFRYFGEGNGKNSEEEKAFIRKYGKEQERAQMLRLLFDQMYFEFLTQSRKNPENPVSRETIGRINRILDPLKTMMKGEEYAEYLEGLPETEKITNSEAAMLLTIFKSTMNWFFQKGRGP